MTKLYVPETMQVNEVQFLECELPVPEYCAIVPVSTVENSPPGYELELDTSEQQGFTEFYIIATHLNSEIGYYLVRDDDCGLTAIARMKLVITDEEERENIAPQIKALQEKVRSPLGGQES